jgi:tetratricopeptide (TPR) repeat protein/predicted flap endonuclease-1-like 5' DNA nuclease
MQMEDNKVASFFGRDRIRGKVAKNENNNSKKIVTEKKDKINKKTKTDLKLGHLTTLKGIGPVVASTLSNAGLDTINNLANSNKEEIEKILVGTRGRHNISDWIKQAREISGIKPSVEKKTVKKSISFEKLKNKNHKKTTAKKRDAKNKRENKLTFRKKVDSLEDTTRKIVKNNIKNKKTQKTNSLFMSSINGLMILLFFGIVLFFTGKTLQGASFEKSTMVYLIGSFIAGLFAIKFIFTGTIKIIKTPLDKIIPLFLLAYFISSWFSVDRWHSFLGSINDPSRGFIFVVIMIIFYYLIVGNFTITTGKKAFRAITIAVVIIGIYTCISGLGLIPENIQNLLPFITTGSISALAVILSVGLVLTVTMFLEKNSSKLSFLKQIILAISILAIIVDLMMLRQFINWNILAVAIVGLIFFLANKNGKELGGKISRIFIFTILTAVIILIGWVKSDYQQLIPVSLHQKATNEIMVGVPISFNIVKKSLTKDWKQGLIGSGPSTFDYALAKFAPKNIKSPSKIAEYLRQGDGFIAEGLPTIGLIGGVLLIIAGIIFVLNLIKSLHTRKEDRAYLIGLAISASMLLMNLAVERTNGGLIIFSILILSLAMLFALKNTNEEGKYYSINLRKFLGTRFIGILGGLLILVCIVISSIYVVRAYQADTYINKALALEDIDQQKELFKKAINLNPNEGNYYNILGRVRLNALVKKINSKEKVSPEKINSINKEVANYFSEGARLMPNNISILRSLATSYKFNQIKNIDEYTKIYNKIIDLEPNNIENYIALGDIYLRNGVREKKDEYITMAIQKYQEALAIQPRVASIYDRLSTAYYKKNNLDMAIENMARSIILQPKNTSYKFTLGVLYQIKGDKKSVENSEKIFKALLVSMPNNIDVLAQLGLLYEKVNNPEEAKKQYERILKITNENKQFKKIDNTFKQYIKNIEEGKSNIKKENISVVVDQQAENKFNGDENKNGDNKQEAKNKNSDNTETKDGDSNSEIKNENTDNKNTETKSVEKVTVTVGIEGPINVRSAGSLAGKKLTKIKETAEFEKIGENAKWVQIIIPAKGNQPEIKGWVHGKFITK